MASHDDDVLRHAAEARARIRQLVPDEARQRVALGGLLLDVRSMQAQYPHRLHVVVCELDNPEATLQLSNALGDIHLDVALFNAGTYGPAHQRSELIERDEIADLFQTNAITNESPAASARRLKPLSASRAGAETASHSLSSPRHLIDHRSNDAWRP